MIQQSTFRVFARRHDQRHSRIVNIDLVRPPDLETLTWSIVQKLQAVDGPSEASSATGNDRYVLLLNDQAVIEDVSELRDGDVVVLHTMQRSVVTAPTAVSSKTERRPSYDVHGWLPLCPPGLSS